MTKIELQVLSIKSLTFLFLATFQAKTEVFCLFRCTSVLSDESELSTPCDGETLGIDDVDYVRKNVEVRPDLLSSSEDSSPEADLPFSKKFLNVFVNSTSRSSSKLHTNLSSAGVYDMPYYYFFC